MDTHRVLRAHGWPIEQPDFGYTQKRYELGVAFDASAGVEVPEVPATADGKTPTMPARTIPFFSKEEIAAAVKGGYLIDLAEEQRRIAEDKKQSAAAEVAVKLQPPVPPPNSTGAMDDPGQSKK